MRLRDDRSTCVRDALSSAAWMGRLGRANFYFVVDEHLTTSSAGRSGRTPSHQEEAGTHHSHRLHLRLGPPPPS